MKRFVTVGCVCLLVMGLGCAKEKYRRTSPEAYYEAAQKALKNDDCLKAQLLFRNMLSDFPGSQLTDDAQFGLGQSYQCSKDYVTAVFEYERLLNEYPVSPHAASARFQIGECYYQDARDIHHDQEETHKAIREYVRFVEDYPQSDLASQAQARIDELNNRLAEKEVMIARNYAAWGYFVSAELYAEQVVAQYPNVPAALEAQLVLARVKYKKEEYEEALDILTLLAGREMPPQLKKQVVEETDRVQKALAKARAQN